MGAKFNTVPQPNDTKDPRAFSEGKKWFILILALLLQAWVNAISVMASSAIEDIAEEMHVTMTVARVIQAGFLYGTALGAIVWTPLSEGKCGYDLFPS